MAPGWEENILGELTFIILSLKKLYTNLLHHLINELDAHWHWMKPRWKLHCESGPASWKLTFSSTLNPQGAKEAWYSHLISCKARIQGFLPLTPPTLCSKLKGFASLERSSGAPAPASEERESGAGPPWPSPWAWLRDSCAAPKPQSTPQRRHHLLLGWLGHTPTPNSTKCYSLIAHQISGEHVSHPTTDPKFIYLASIFCFMLIEVFLSTGKRAFSNSFDHIQDLWNKWRILWCYQKANHSGRSADSMEEE